MKYKVKKWEFGGGEEREYLESWSLGVDFFSTPRTTASKPRTPTAAFPLRTASRAYSTWNKWPSGEILQSARWSSLVSENQKKKVSPCESLFIYLFFFGFCFEWQALILVSKRFNSYSFVWNYLYILVWNCNCTCHIL